MVLKKPVPEKGGSVVGSADESLCGLRVMVTRPVSQAQSLMERLRQCQAVPIEFPTIEIVAVEIDPSLQRMIEGLDHYQQVVFVSANAAQIGCECLADYWPQWPVGIDWVAVGPATAAVLDRFGLAATMPGTYDSEGILKLSQFGVDQIKSDRQRKVLLVRGQGGRPLLPDTLRARGATVDIAQVYRRQIPSCWDRGINDVVFSAAVDIVLITSVESLRNLLSMIDVPAGGGRRALLQLPLLVVSERIAAVARELGFAQTGSAPIYVAQGADDDSVMAALKRYARQ